MIIILIIMPNFIKNEDYVITMLCVGVCVCVFMCRRPHFKITLNELLDFHVKWHGSYAIRDYITHG